MQQILSLSDQLTPLLQAARKAAEQASQQQARTAGLLLAGHQATVNCLRSERGQTDGSDLRCEAWGYVQANYPGPQP